MKSTEFFIFLFTGSSRQVRYSLIDSADAHFTIDDAEGVISLARPLDREARDMYSITVRATDQGAPPLSSSTSITITVTGE